MSPANLVDELYSQLDPNQFELFLSLLLDEMGFSDVSVTGRSGDRGIDLEAIWNEENVPGLQVDLIFKIQAKKLNPASALNPRYVRELRGSLQSGQWGLLITTAHVTGKTRQEGLADGSRVVSIIDGKSLVELCIKYNVGVKADYRIDLSMMRPRVIQPTIQEFVERSSLDILNMSLSENFLRLGSSLIYKSDTKTVLARTSKRYDRTDFNFWYGIKPKDIDKVREYRLTHFAFICSDEGVILIPTRRMLTEIKNDNLSKSTTKDGELRHYHVQFYERDQSVYWRLKSDDKLVTNDVFLIKK